MSGQPTSRPTLCSERKTQNRALRKGMGTAVFSGTHTTVHSIGKGGPPGAGETGEMKRMKESYGEGVANHTGPESCVASREAGYRSVDRGNCGPGHGTAKHPRLRDADAMVAGGRQHPAHR